jgi:alpha-L-arabinofuranosidase
VAVALAATVFAGLPGIVTAAQPALPVSAVPVAVHAGQAGPVINRDIFGQFAEHLGEGIYGGLWVGPNSPIPNVRGLRSDVVKALKELKIPNVRWPGGCFADEYHWRAGIGPAAKRPVTLNPNWGGVTESNQFGTHEFFDFLDQIGSDAYVSVNMGSGTTQEAADWAEYMTAAQPTALAQERAANGHKAPYKLRLLGLGNEAWGCGGSMTPEHYVDEMKAFARTTRNYDPAQTGANAMKRIAVGPDGEKTEYTEAVMKAWKEKVWSWDIEGISMHHYTVAGWPPSYNSAKFGEKEYAALVADALDMERLVTMNAAIMDRYDPAKKIGLIVDEWGVWLAPLEGTNPAFLVQQNTIRDGVIAALHINIFSRHADRVKGANIAQMVNVLQAMVLTNGPKMLLTPTYHVFHMYKPFQDATLVPLTYFGGTFTAGEKTLPRLDAISARDAQGRLWLAVTNLDPNRPARIDLAVDGLAIRSAAGEMLTAPSVDSHNTFEAPDVVKPRPFEAQARNGVLSLDLPGKSVTVVRLSP